MALPEREPAQAMRFGATAGVSGVEFLVWSPAADRVTLLLSSAGQETCTHEIELHRASDVFAASVAHARPGDLYWLRLDGRGPFPDPASRFQPQGVHGPSEIVDSTYPWTDHAWTGVAAEDLVFYELHVGTFTPNGTFAGVIERLPYLKDLGVTAIELMPIADFPGCRNWGYDGVSLYAPARCYGRPEQLRRLVDEAHRVGLAVFLDVVYNHLGPDGAYLGVFAPQFLSNTHRSPWGAGVNLDGPGSEYVRAFLMQNALHWVHEYHVDGLRLDATHALEDTSRRHFVAELADAVHDARPGLPTHVVAEDCRNLDTLVRARPNGFGLDGVWADDLHHQVRRMIAGDSEGYYRDFFGTIGDIVTTINHGWFFSGQYSAHFNAPRGTDATGIPKRRFVVCLQNHDQVGNRAFGERIHHQVDVATYRAASVLVVLAPETPLLFMGQEWAASSPFLFFTDHHEELGKEVTKGRRREFRQFSDFADPRRREQIPDPQAPSTFDTSRLRWEELSQSEHRRVAALYRALLRLRSSCIARLGARTEPLENLGVAAVVDEDSLVLTYEEAGLAAIIRLRGAGDAVIPAPWSDVAADTIVLTTEDPAFAPDPVPIGIDREEGGVRVRFARPGAVVAVGGGRPVSP